MRFNANLMNNSVGYNELFDENSISIHISNYDRIELS